MRLFFALFCSCIFLSCRELHEFDLAINGGLVLSYEHNGFEKINLGIKSGRIVKMSESPLVGEKNINLNGEFIYPGIIDAHCHFVGYAKGLNEVDLVGCQSFEEVVNRVVEFRKKNPEVTFISGRGWDQNLWAVKDFPHHQQLSAAVHDIPVILKRVDGHAALINQVMIDQMGNLPEHISGGKIIRVNGELTGVLIDKAMELIPDFNSDRNAMADALVRAELNCFSLGITGLADAGLDASTILFLDSLLEKGYLKIPLYAMISDHPDYYEQFFTNGPLIRERLKVRSVKVYGDGALGSRGALLLAPYADDHHNYGLKLIDQEYLKELSIKAVKSGFQVNVHAIGDSANRMVLQVFSDVLEPDNDLRWRVEHAQVVHPDDHHYFGEFKIIPSVQPTHATSDMAWASDRLGKHRISHAYAYKDLLGSAGILALGTDFPVEDIDPRKTFYSAVVRKSSTGVENLAFMPEQALNRIQALKGMTLWAAYAQFEELEKGSIEEQKWADLFISPVNLLTCEEDDILKMPVQMTILRGEVVFQK